MNKKIAFLLKIYGTVQGVGFRPKIYNLAKKHELTGFVLNTSYGVEITIEGLNQNIKRFIFQLKKQNIDRFEIVSVLPKKYKKFLIKKSLKNKNIISDFPADIALCSECKKELLSSQDRRHYYPFINCTQCGPRYSIVKKLPYDRKNTVMNNFKMCPKCSDEYTNISDRRFHAQPNACERCGPKVKLLATKNNKTYYTDKSLQKTAQMLDTGKIVAIKSIGGYHLACDAYNTKTILNLRKLKNRDKKPFALMAKDINTARKLVNITKWEEKELTSSIAPIILLRKNQNINPIFNEYIAKNNNYLGIMLPYTPIHYILFDLLKTDVLIMTSANKNDEPIIYTENKILKEFSKTIEGILSNDRAIHNPVDDSIVLFFDKDKKIIIRRSRGFVPNPINMEIEKNILAIGSDLKNSFCLTRQNSAYLSPYCGDMIYYDNINFLEQTMNKMTDFLDVKSNKIVCDLHPQYNTTIFAKKRFKNVTHVQHHYAHIASVIAENNIKNNVIGFAFDGTGFGYDNNIWGSECILFKNNTIKRLSHFEYFDLLGGDIATKEIWRLAVSIFQKYNKLNLLPNHIKKEKLYNAIVSISNSNIKHMKVCSVGRFIDAMACIIGLSNYCEYEGQTAIHLESLLIKNKYTSYPFDIKIEKNKPAIIKFEKVVDALLNDLKNKISMERISGKIHETICQIIYKQA
ncbi:MAG: carbamoyltransferase HypF, partial [Endomicrobiaceae bacterium]|nr:carbamoyltransferase HypF [Endomicrobiaceae bacterium]